MQIRNFKPDALGLVKMKNDFLPMNTEIDLTNLKKVYLAKINYN